MRAMEVSAYGFRVDVQLGFDRAAITPRPTAIRASVTSDTGLQRSIVRPSPRPFTAGAWAPPVKAERVGQVVANLLSNALKHTRRGGRVSLGLRQEGPWAVIEVSDSGRGIAEEDLPRVFERFYRGSRPKGRGSGIGLAVVRELAEAHGGRAIVESPAGSGAVFRVVLPARPAAGSAAA